MLNTFRPSLDTIDDDHLDEKSFYEQIIEAENYGKRNESCSIKYNECSLSLVDLFTTKITSLF